MSATQDSSKETRWAVLKSDALPRGLALFLGGFSLLNLAGSLRDARFDENLWWIDLRFVPHALVWALLFVSSILLLAFGIRPPRSVWRRFLTAGCAALLAMGTIANTAQFYVLLARHALRAGVPIPLSLPVGAALVIIVIRVLQPSWLRTERGKLVRAIAVCLLCGLAFPLAEMLCFGKTDYRRPADVAVVLGARVYADGRPSDALADRVRTACELYRGGWVKKLIVSGGPGDGAIPEADAMSKMAIELGVRPEDILEDEAGVNTQATVWNTEAMFARLGATRVLVVSHFYHLPRIKMAYEREGWEVYTVPARESYLLGQMPYNMAREIAALWVYYLRPLTGHSAHQSTAAAGHSPAG